MSFLRNIFTVDLMNQNSDKATKIENQNRELYTQNGEIAKLKNELNKAKEDLAKAKNSAISPWKIGEMEHQETLNKELQKEIDYYKSLLSKPMLEIAKKDKHFKKTYEKQQAILAKFIIENSAMKELAQEYGLELGKSDEDFSQNLDIARDKVLSGKSDFSNNVDQSVVSAIEKDKENKIEEEKRKIEQQERLRLKSEADSAAIAKILYPNN